MWQFAEAVAGIGDACRALDVPITGGNVSLYNETDGQPILPTPVIGVVGVMDNANSVLTRVFPGAGLDIVLLGDNRGELGGSEYLKTMHGIVRGRVPELDLARERSLHLLLVDLAAKRLVRSAHDCAEGGVAVALAECCFDSGGVGASVDVSPASSDGGVDLSIATLFGESASRVIVGVEPARVDEVLAAANHAGISAARIGQSGGSAIRVSIAGTLAIDMSLADAEARWSSALSDWLDGKAA
jgi:phosphoribosylformylglycinamidine synthase